MGNKRTVAASRRRACIIRFQIDDKAAEREAWALTRAGFDVDVLLAAGPTGGSTREADNVRYTQLPVKKQRGSGPRYLYEYAAWFGLCGAWLAKESRHRPFDYVQIDTLPDHQVFVGALTKLQGAVIGIFLKEPTEELVQTMTDNTRTARMAGLVAKGAVGFADIAFCVTEEHRQSYIAKGADAEKLHVVLNSMPPFPKASRSRAANDGNFVAVSHGSIEPRYGHQTILEAAAIARHELPGLRIHLPGRGTATESVRELVANLGLDKIVTLDGWLSDEELAQLLADADVGLVAQDANPYSHLVHTTKMYDFLEAAVPVLASRLRATENLLPTELSYFEANDPQSLAVALVELAADRQHREIKVAAGLARLDEIGWRAQMERMASVVKQACRDNERGTS